MKTGWKIPGRRIIWLDRTFAAYGFGKAHAALLRHGFLPNSLYDTPPVEFMAAVMTAEYGNTGKIAHAPRNVKGWGLRFATGH